MRTTFSAVPIKNVSFNVYRDGKKISEVATKTNYVDSTVGTNYSVAPVINGVEGEKMQSGNGIQ